MIGRREFLTNAAGVFFVGCACGHATGVMSQGGRAKAVAPRREISIDGKPVKLIEFHAHCFVPALPEVIRGTPLDRSLPKNQIIAQARLDALDQRGIDTQVLSTNQYWWYGADRDLAAKIVSTNDEGLAGLC